MHEGNRRIDKVLDPEFVDGLGQISLDELRERRKEAEQEETDLSYMRRLLQGRLDILRAELARRAGDGSDLMDALPQILADEPSGGPHGLGRHVTAVVLLDRHEHRCRSRDEGIWHV